MSERSVSDRFLSEVPSAVSAELAKVLSLKLGVVRNINMHALHTARKGHKSEV